jgi:mannose-6-phosphate isomerase-like protein (cupin superfamily)
MFLDKWSIFLPAEVVCWKQQKTEHSARPCSVSSRVFGKGSLSYISFMEDFNMVIHRNEMKNEKKEKMRGGEGTASLTYLVDCENEKNIRMLAEITLPPGASIGPHTHDAETEYFLFLSGSGVVNDNGRDIPVAAGDAMITGNGACHNIKNTGSVPLVFHAAVVTY